MECDYEIYGSYCELERKLLNLEDAKLGLKRQKTLRDLERRKTTGGLQSALIKTF